MPKSTDTTAPETATETTTTTATAGPKPPWGSDAEFNPEKAWNLIQNLRTEASEAKSKFETASKEAKDLEQFRIKAQEADEARAETEITLHREKAARTHRLNDEQYEFLSELTDPEAIAKRAEKLAAMSTKPDTAVDHAQGVTATTSASPEEDFADFLTNQLK